MTERPIPFSAPMVRAVLAGEKTQTRRIAKLNAAGRVARGGRNWHLDDPSAVLACPHGQPGDRLWVREAWTADFEWPSDTGERICWWHEVPAAFRGLRNVMYTYYRADGSAWHCDEHGACCPADQTAWRIDFEDDDFADIRWRPSIHMPRWASRITLELTSVRVERVQDISTKDAEAEIGNGGRMILPSGLCNTYVGTFAHAWNAINAKRGYGWDANPWVWVLEFTHVDAPIAQQRLA